MEVVDCGVESNGPLHQLHGNVISSDLMGDQTQMVLCPSVFGPLGQDLTVDLLCLVQTSGLVLLDGQIEGLLEGQLRHECKKYESNELG